MTDNMDKDNLPESIIMGPDTTCSPLFWDEDEVTIGDYDLFFIGDEEYSTSSLIGLKEWFLKADTYDPYTDIAQFTTDGMEEWINQGYEYAKQLRSMIPNSVNCIMDIGTSLVMVIGDGVKHTVHKNNKGVYAKSFFEQLPRLTQERQSTRRTGRGYPEPTIR